MTEKVQLRGRSLQTVGEVGKLKKLNDVEFMDFSEYANALGSDIAQLEKKLPENEAGSQDFQEARGRTNNRVSA